MCVGVGFWSVFGAGTPVASFSVAKRELAFRLLFNKPADGAYWLWMDGDTHWESQKEEKMRKTEKSLWVGYEKSQPQMSKPNSLCSLLHSDQ